MKNLNEITEFKVVIPLTSLRSSDSLDSDDLKYAASHLRLLMCSVPKMKNSLI